jgi:hypothetical protein
MSYIQMLPLKRAVVCQICAKRIGWASAPSAEYATEAATRLWLKTWIATCAEEIRFVLLGLPEENASQHPGGQLQHRALRPSIIPNQL